jgi:thiosulfate/3-mercaptopyruvate sulfurtransferase
MKKRGLILLMTLVLTSAVFAGCSSNTGTSTTTPAKTVGTAVDGNEASIETAAIKLVNQTKAGGYNLVSTADLKSWVDSGKAMVVIDTMPASSFTDGHIKGAVNAELPKTQAEGTTAEQKAAFIKLLPADKNATIVVYCGFVACGRSDVGAVIAMQEGYTNVYRYSGGIVAWKDAGYEVVK